MRVSVRIHGVLSVAAAIGDGPVDVPPGTTVEEFLRLIGLVDASPALVVLNGRVARSQDLLAEGDDLSLLARVSGG